MGWLSCPSQVCLPASGPSSSPAAAEWGGSVVQVRSAHLPPCQAPTVLACLEAVRKIVLWWVLAQVTYTKQSLQRYHYLWRKVGKEPLRWEFSKLWEEGQGLCSPELPKLRFCFQSRCHSYHSAKHWFHHTPLVWKPPKSLRCHILISIFFPQGEGKR